MVLSPRASRAGVLAGVAPGGPLGSDRTRGVPATDLPGVAEGPVGLKDYDLAEAAPPALFRTSNSCCF